MTEARTMTGVVKWFNERKGYGFITTSNGGPEVFVHRSRIIGRNSLRRGDWVEFEVAQAGKKIQAVNVRVLD